MSDEDKPEGASLSKDTRFLLGGLFSLAVTIAVPLIGFGWTQSIQAQGAVKEISEIKTSMNKLNDTVSKLISEDMADVKARLRVIENKKILPEANERIKELAGRVRVLEIERAQ